VRVTLVTNKPAMINYNTFKAAQAPKQLQYMTGKAVVPTD
jgi:hypothetical protein